jgi:hypothetical protein
MRVARCETSKRPLGSCTALQQLIGTMVSEIGAVGGVIGAKGGAIGDWSHQHCGGLSCWQCDPSRAQCSHKQLEPLVVQSKPLVGAVWSGRQRNWSGVVRA